MKRQRVVHLITGLGKGGAETMLYQIIKNRTLNELTHIVVSLGLSHYYEEPIQNLGVKVINLDIKHHLFQSLNSLSKIGKKADVLCCWMYFSNLIGYLFGRKHVKKLIWCIRHSDLSVGNNSLKTIWFSKICARLSRRVDLIAYNGFRAKEIHEKAGYRAKEEIVLENGIDGTEYFYDAQAGEESRRCMEIGGNCKVILSVARNTSIKDLPTFIRTLSLVRKSEPKAIGIMCGEGVDTTDRKLITCCKKNGLSVGKDVYLIGFCNNIQKIMNAADVYVLHSAGEAFPNTLIQAMACEKLVAATDVGDVKKILDDEELIAEPGDYEGLAEIVLRLLEMDEEKKELYQKRNREIVLAKYDIHRIIEDYEKIFRI